MWAEARLFFPWRQAPAQCKDATELPEGCGAGSGGDSSGLVGQSMAARASPTALVREKGRTGGIPESVRQVNGDEAGLKAKWEAILQARVRARP